MELVEHRRGVQRLGNELRDSHTSEDDAARVTRNGRVPDTKKDLDDDRDTMSDCDSETSEVLSVGSEPTPAADGLGMDHEDEPPSGENYESDNDIATRGIDTSGEREQTSANGGTTKERSSVSSRSPSPAPSSSASCEPPRSPGSNYCATPPRNRLSSPSSPAASSARSPASSSATVSSPGRPDAHQEAIVPRYQSANLSASVHHHGHGNPAHNQRDANHQHHHLLSSSRYAAAALVTQCRDTELGEYPSIVGGSTITRIPVHHPIGLTNVSSHGTTAVADLIGYSQQSIDPARSLHARVASTLNVPLVTRLTLSPPTAMTVTGLQANPPSTAFHPVAVAAAAAAAAAAAGSRDPRETNPLLAVHPTHFPHSGHSISGVQHSLMQQQTSVGASQIQHVSPSSMVLQHHQHHHQQQQQNHHLSHNSRHGAIGNQSSSQHRLSVTKLLQHNSHDTGATRDTGSPESPEPRNPEDHHRPSTHCHRHADTSRNSPGNHSLQNSSGVTTTAGNHHRNNNNNSTSSNNNMQHQASLKFSIDNILKADFGRRITDPISLKKSRTKKAVPRPIDLTKDFRETSSEGSERGTEISAANLSPGSTTTVNNGAASNNATSGAATTGNTSTTGGGATTDPSKQMLWPAWVYCTRYSDRPSSGPRTRRVKRTSDSRSTGTTPEEKRPRTAFSGEQLARLKREFGENRYLTERRRQQLSRDLGLNEAQIKIWFQNKRAKIKKASGQKNPLALQLMAQGLYNHSTVPLTKEEEEQAAELQAK